MDSETKLKLFDDDEDQEEDDQEFNLIDEKLIQQDDTGTKTSKLIELKTKFSANQDERFKIDSRFLDDDTEQEICDQQTNLNEAESEKQKNLEILSQVIGKPVKTSAFRTVNRPLFTPRFDPSNDECCRMFELKKPAETSKRLRALDFDEIDRKIELEKKRKLDHKQEQEMLLDSAKPEQDQEECYFEVGKNLKQVFKQTEDFTLGSLFDPGVDSNESNEPEKLEPDSKPDIKHSKSKNPFRYDSSDSEPEPEIQKPTKISATQKILPKPNSSDLGFFFDLNDPRLQEPEDEFYSPDLILKVQENGNERRIEMIRALSLRKKSSLKNKRTEEKYTEKQRKHKQFIVQQTKRKRKKFGYKKRIQGFKKNKIQGQVSKIKINKKN